ncbi:MAG: AI-2E family transporter [Hyphomicrobiaceae bacterium]|nr:AI-2E family transporter [Hyphomicrobiaceae bacterium]
MSDHVFLRRLLVTFLIAALAAAMWMLLDLILVAFASVLLAIMLRAISVPVATRLGIPEGWCVLATILAIVAVLAGAIWLFGSQITDQLFLLRERLSPELDRVKGALSMENLDNTFGASPASALGNLLSRAISWGSTLAGSLASLVIVIFGGIYFALDPQHYRRGCLKLVPEAYQQRVEETLDDCGVALRHWLAAQFVAMVSVGVLTGVALYLVGVPSALALGLIAGLAEFIPFVGPVISAVPGLLLAGSQDWQTFWWALGAYVLIQQLENNLLVPMLASRNVSIPAGLAIFAVVAMGIVFGFPGLLLGFPLTVVAVVMIKRLYVEDTLGQSVGGAGGSDGSSEKPGNE